MSKTHMREKGQLTLPAPIRRAARLEEGDPIEVELVEDGILLRPQKVIDAAQAWFWSAAWQREERRADADLAKGRSERFAAGDDFLAALRARSK